MAKAWGTRIAAGLFLAVSFAPPWLQAVVTLPLGVSLLRSARQKEQERKRELEALED